MAILLLSIIPLGVNTNSVFSKGQLNDVNVLWAGDMNGAFNGDIHTAPYTIVLQSKMNGTLQGFSEGKITGKYNADIEIYPNSIRQQDIGHIIGNYTMILSDEGVIIGEGDAKIIGALQGELKFQLRGNITNSENINGIWYGVAKIETITFKEHSLKIDMKLPVSGIIENGPPPMTSKSLAH